MFIGSAIKRDKKPSQVGKKKDADLSQDYATSNLMIENNDLKKRIFNLE